MFDPKRVCAEKAKDLWKIWAELVLSAKKNHDVMAHTDHHVVKTLHFTLFLVI